MPSRILRSLLLLASTWLALVGCAAVKVPDEPASAGAVETAPAQEESPLAVISPALLQQSVMDFSDQYVSGLWPAFDEYARHETDATRRSNAQKWKVMLSATSMTIAGSRDPRAALLDMVVFISAGRWAVDKYWIPEVFGEGAGALRTLYAEMDRKVWEEAARVLTPGQQEDLRNLIAAWMATNPPRSELLDVRLRNLEGVELSRFSDSSSARGLMAKIQRLLGKVDQSLLYGERVLFYMQRVPRLLEQQSDLTIDRVAERFPIATVNPDFSGLAALAETWPQQINDTLLAHEGVVGKSLPDVRASIESVERLLGSLQQTVESANQLAGKAEKLPFAREDYTLALQETSNSLTQLNGLVTGLNQLLDTGVAGEPKVVQMAELLDKRADEVLDKVFERALILLGVFFGGVLLSLVAARVLLRRPPAPPPPAAPSS